MSSLADHQKKLLLEIARKSIVAAVEGRPALENLPKGELGKPGGAFVTLHLGSRLRGCIGQLPGEEPLIEVVARCARLAALEDPRFMPVTVEEVPGLEIEISVLSEPADIAPQDIVPGRDGLLVSRGWERGVLLPQVATQFGWNALRFLEETCVKAGLSQHAWKEPGTRIQAFTAEVFSEAETASCASPKDCYSIST